MNDLQALLLETQSRYQAREDEREVREKNLSKGGDWRKVDEPNRIRRRLEKLGMESVISEAMATTETVKGAPTLNVLERIMDQNELQGIAFLLQGAVVARTIGRIVGRSTRNRVTHYGTGFFVSRHLLLTNNHVIWDRLVGRNSAVQLNYYESYEGQLMHPVEYRLLPDAFFITNKQLDFTLIAVSEVDVTGQHHRPAVWNPLIRESGKAIVGERVNIIQHPGGEPMQLALRANQIVDVFDSFLHYKTDTQPGSSGAPVYNDQWEVAALHHSGVPERDRQKRILMTNGQPWDGSRDTLHMVAWRANEGVRISQIVSFIDRRRLSRRWQSLYEQVFEPSSALETAIEAAGDAPTSAANRPPTGPIIEPDGSVSFYYRINVGPVGGVPVSPTAPVPPVPVDGSPPPAPPADSTPPLVDDAAHQVDDHAGTGAYYDETADHAERDAYYADALKGNINGPDALQAAVRAAGGDAHHPVIVPCGPAGSPVSPRGPPRIGQPAQHLLRHDPRPGGGGPAGTGTAGRP
jgi:endonuclease G